MQRVTTNVQKSVKQILHDLKDKLGVKNESEVIAYLYAIYEDRYPKITLIEHDQAMKRVEEIHSQGTL